MPGGETTEKRKSKQRALLSDHHPSRPIGRSGAHYKKFEERRKNHVPRFLFRFWRPLSGGGPKHTINSTMEIKPHAFMPGNSKYASRFYDTAGSKLYHYAISHYYGKKDIKSPFSSWASSLHVVLSLAVHHDEQGDDNTGYISIMDTQDQENEVLVWHVPDLIKAGNHEFLAWGHITGRGHKAVRWRDLQEQKLSHIFPELRPRRDVWGCALRRTVFNKPPSGIPLEELDNIRNIALLFGHFFLPVAAALICLRPRRFLTADAIEQEYSISGIIHHLRITELPVEFQGIHQERWLEAGMVDTKGFPDVELWIRLLDLVVRNKLLETTE